MSYSIGIQLYSVRDSMESDFEGTLRKIAELGYKSVEFAGFYGRTPEQINALLSELGLELSGTHSSFDELVNNYDNTVAFHKAIGNKNYIIPWYDLFSQEKIDLFVSNAKSVIEKLKADGITLSFHNHSKEFTVNEDGSNAFEQLIYRTEIGFEVDTYWAFVGMKSPIKLLERIKDRITFIHLKDGSSDGNGTPLGMGEAPVSEVVAYAKENGIPMVVESETCTPSGLEEARICIDYYRSLSV